MPLPLYFATGFLLFVLWSSRHSLQSFLMPRRPGNWPPIVKLTEHEIFDDPRASYERVLRENGPVVGVKRKGQLEYIVSQEHIQQVLTDDALFSFEGGIAKMLNLNLMSKLGGGSWFKDIDVLVNELVSQRMDIIVRQIYPIFQQHANELAQKSSEGPIDLFKYAQQTISDAMLRIIFGEEYINEENRHMIITTAEGVANLTGMYQNASFFGRNFPSIWKAVMWVKVMVFEVGLAIVSTIAPAVWREVPLLAEKSSEVFDKEDRTVLAILSRRYASPDGTVSVGSKLWIISLLIGAIFASVHQTVIVIVWVVFEIAKRPEFQPIFREELSKIIDEPLNRDIPASITYQNVKDAVHVDSFIREVMRMKGDTLGQVRMTTKDVPVGPVVIPKGNLVMPMISLWHRSTSYHGGDAEKFDGARWIGKDKPATMTTPGYLAFGMGRWACPGRQLAIAEIKMVIFSLIATMDLSLVGKSYEVVDMLNVVSVAPKGQLILNPVS